tara:strand:- start:1384 stop:1503 length:120 start_codon:yes stop_codon:yes gene_type:complete
MEFSAPDVESSLAFRRAMEEADMGVEGWLMSGLPLGLQV